MKKFIAVLMSCLLMFSVVACGAQEEPSTPGTSEVEEITQESAKTIGILIVTSGSQWCNSIVDSVTAVAEEAGHNVIVSDSQVSTDNELSGMENLINSNCDAIVVNAMNPAGLSELCAQAKEKGIYIIGWSDLLVNYDALVVEDAPKESEMMAEAIADYINNSEAASKEMATIWIADAANPDTTTGVFKAALEEEFEKTLVSEHGMEIVNSQYASDATKAMEIADAIIAAEPDIKVIFCQSDEMGVAVAQAIASRGYGTDDILVCGLDGSAEALNTIAGGSSNLKYTVFSDVDYVGKKVGESVCTFLISGEANDVVAEYVLVDSNNASEYIKE